MRTIVRNAATIVALTLGLASGLHAQTADELVDKNLKAKGGVDKLRAVQSLRVTGRVMMPAAGMEFPVTITTKKPSMFYQQSVIQGQKVETGFDGDKAWMINPLMGAVTPQEIKGPQLNALKGGIDVVGPLVDYKTKGTIIETAGTDTLDGKPVHKLKVIPKQGPTVTVFLDDDTGLETKAIMESAATDDAPAVKMEVLYSNYKPEGGINMPHTIEQKVNGQAVQVTIDKVEVSPTIDDAIFHMPTAPATAPAPKPGQ